MNSDKNKSTFSPRRGNRYRCSCHGTIVKKDKLEAHRSLSAKPRPARKSARHVVITSDARWMTCPCCKEKIPFPGGGLHSCTNCDKLLDIDVRQSGNISFRRPDPRRDGLFGYYY